MQVTVSVAIMQLEVSAAHKQVAVSETNMWMTIFIVIKQMGVCYNYTGGISCSALCIWLFQVTISYSVLYLTVSLHKIDQKTFKSIISSLHFTTFVNILPKLRYFEGRNDIQIRCKSYSVLLFSWETNERWGHLGFLERGES